jgi:hypothetical protein
MNERKRNDGTKEKRKKREQKRRDWKNINKYM